MTDLWGSWRQILDLSAWYSQAPLVADGLIYLTLMTGIAKVTVGRRFSGRGSTAITIALGLSLTAGLLTVESQTGFRLGDLGGLAWLILIGVLGFLLFDLVRSAGVPLIPAVALALVGIGVSSATAAQSIWALPALAPFRNLAGLAAVAGVILLVYWLLDRRGMKRGHGDHPRPTQQTPVEPRHDERVAFSVPSESVEQIELSVLDLIRRVQAAIAREGVGPRSTKLLLEISRRNRMVHLLYKQALRYLARLRLKAHPDRSRIPESMRTLLMAAQENQAQFQKVLEVAVAANAEGNVKLLVETLQRLERVETEAIRIAAELREFTQKLRTMRVSA